MSQDHYLDTRKVFSKETIASMSDKDLGLYVFGVFVAHVAAETNSTFESVSQKFTNDPNCLETETIDSVAFASTLRFAARGEPQKAGSLFRADLAKGALSLATLDMDVKFLPFPWPCRTYVGVYLHLPLELLLIVLAPLKPFI